MLALLAVGAVVTLVWGWLFFHRGSLLWGALLFLVTAYCWGRDFFRFEFGPLPMTLERPVLAVLMLMGLYQVAMRVRPAARFTAVEWTLAAFAVLLTISTFQHDWAWNRYVPVYRLVACYLMPIALYLTIRNAQMSETTLRRFYLGLTLFGVYLAATALAEYAQQWWLVYPNYIADPKLGIHYGRARGPALQAQSLGLYLGLCGLGAWTWLPRWGMVGVWARWALAPLFLAAIFCTSTRSPWLGTAAAGLIVFTCSLPRSWRPLVVMASAVLVVLLFWNREALMEVSRGDQSQVASRDSVNARTLYAHVSWLMFQDRPLWGCGAGQFVPEATGYLSDHSIEGHLAVIGDIPHHNTFLCLLVETGVLGCGLFLAILFGWTRTAYRLWRTAEPGWARAQGVLTLASLGMYLPDAIFFDPGSFAHQDHYFVFLAAGVTSGVAASLAPARARAVAPVAAAIPTRATTVCPT